MQQYAQSAGAHLYSPDDKPSQALEEALTTLLGRRIVVRTADGRYRANEKEKDLIAYYANSIDQFLCKTDD